MKLIEKIILIIYSIIILILSSVFCLLIFRWIDPNCINNFVVHILNNYICTSVTLVISIIFIFISIKCIFFLSKKSDFYKDNILLKNENGKLVITKDAIVNMANNAIKGFESANEVTIKVKFDKENNIIINVSLLAKNQANITELSNNIQTKIRDSIKKVSDLNVKEINIKINNVETVENIIAER